MFERFASDAHFQPLGGQSAINNGDVFDVDFGQNFQGTNSLGRKVEGAMKLLATLIERQVYSFIVESKLAIQDFCWRKDYYSSFLSVSS